MAGNNPGMQRGSDKHSPEVDDEMKKETEPLTRGAPVEPHVEEWLQKEPSGDDEPEVAPRIEPPA